MQLRLTVTLLVLLVPGAALAFDWDTYDVDDYEESAGAGAAFEFNPSDGIYGISVQDGTWLAGTPVFGDFFAATFYNGIEESMYGGGGLTLRLMPHWDFAPFAGGGGSYNLSFGGPGEEAEDGSVDEDGEPVRKGESYWAGHVEAGLRIRGGSRFYELLGRYTWSSSDLEEADYWLVRIGYGFPL